MTKLIKQYMFNSGKGPWYLPSTALPEAGPTSSAVRAIAYYLPQFHRIAENDDWWGAGFTEWTNVTKALPRYIGHRQPRLPADLGFYNLRDAEVLRQQAALAKRAGIYGFCIHNYWFSGKQVLETPLNLLLANPDIDLPFCLNWANENWTRRWDGLENEVLLHQRYEAGDDIGYLRSILKALRDPRYIRINGRPLLMIYRPSLIPEMAAVAMRWRSFLIKEGVGDPYLVMAHAFDDLDPRKYGLDAAAGFPPHNSGPSQDRRDRLALLDDGFVGVAQSYAGLSERMLALAPEDYRLFPGVCPSWDNEARKPGLGSSFYGANPAIYGSWLAKAASRAAQVPCADERIVFINAWNEWAEGAVLEPDRHYGHAYLVETRRVLDAMVGAQSAAPSAQGRRLRGFEPKLSLFNYIPNRVRRIRRKLAARLSRQ